MRPGMDMGTKVWGALGRGYVRDMAGILPGLNGGRPASSGILLCARSGSNTAFAQSLSASMLDPPPACNRENTFTCTSNPIVACFSLSNTLPIRRSIEHYGQQLS